MQSCLYEGWVSHSRYQPVEHSFRYQVTMAYLDLAELEELAGSGKLISRRKFAPASFLSHDHLDGFEQPQESLSDTVRAHINRTTGRTHDGPIRLLTQLRHFGYYFSPLNLYYCFSSATNDLETIVAEVSNTPWNERHHYVLHDGNEIPRGAKHHYRHAKSFHVSPFMDMNGTYDWRLRAPGDALTVSIRCEQNKQRFFQAGMAMRRREWSRSVVRAMYLRYPLIPYKIVSSIYWQALRLWMKKCPFYPHPSQNTNPHVTSNA